MHEVFRRGPGLGDTSGALGNLVLVQEIPNKVELSGTFVCCLNVYCIYKFPIERREVLPYLYK